MGVKRVKTSSPKLKKIANRGVQKAIRQGAYDSGRELSRELKTELTKKGRSGRRYKVYKGIGGRKLARPRMHIASTHDEIPATITGAFRNSINFLVKTYRYLEFGTTDEKGKASFLEKTRKPIGKTVDKNQLLVQKNIRDHLKKLFK